MTKYEEYLQKYATKHNLTKEEAETHALVILIKKFYEES